MICRPSKRDRYLAWKPDRFFKEPSNAGYLELLKKKKKKKKLEKVGICRLRGYDLSTL